MTSGLVLVNGASGKIGTTLRSGLREAGWRLRLQDIEPLGEAAEGEELVQGDMFGDIPLLRSGMLRRCPPHRLRR